MTERTDAAWDDPAALWGLILEDEAAGDAAKLGEIAEHLFADVAEARSQAARLRADVHNLAGQLRRHAPVIPAPLG